MLCQAALIKILRKPFPHKVRNSQRGIITIFLRKQLLDFRIQPCKSPFKAASHSCTSRRIHIAFGRIICKKDPYRFTIQMKHLHKFVLHISFISRTRD